MPHRNVWVLHFEGGLLDLPLKIQTTLKKYLQAFAETQSKRGMSAKAIQRRLTHYLQHIHVSGKGWYIEEHKPYKKIFLPGQSQGPSAKRLRLSYMHMYLKDWKKIDFNEFHQLALRDGMTNTRFRRMMRLQSVPLKYTQFLRRKRYRR